MVQATKTVTHAQAALLVRNKPTYHEAMMRSGYEMPSVNCALCSLEWMQAVRAGECYCPKSTDVKAWKKCFSPPTRQILMDKLKSVL